MLSKLQHCKPKNIFSFLGTKIGYHNISVLYVYTMKIGINKNDIILLFQFCCFAIISLKILQITRNIHKL